MCELVAAYILATWFIEAFTVAGYLWITGGRGSGKTQLLNLISELAYLGQVILASSSVPTMRDLADCGAFLGFDDAENLTNAKHIDADKRALILAGNRRGNKITVKEPIPNDRGWQTRFVSTFCHKGFPVAVKPEAILSSRTVIIPLVRTANKAKANLDPLDEENWQFSPDDLRSKLWQIVLKELPNIQKYERDVNNRALISGRNIEAWRGILTVALWLDQHGENGKLKRKPENSGDSEETIGLFQRLDLLSRKYQSIRNDFEKDDYTSLVLRAIVKRILPNIGTFIDGEKIKKLKPVFYLTTGQITDEAKKIVEEEELDFEIEWIKDRKIGRVIKQLRFTLKRECGTGRSGWNIKSVDLVDLLDSYGLLSHSVENETNSDYTISISSTSSISQTSQSADHKNEVNEINEISEIKEVTNEDLETNQPDSNDDGDWMDV